MVPTPPLTTRLKPLVLLGFGVGAIRYLMEFVAPGQAMWFGLYYVMPIALLVIGWRGTWGRITWPALAGTMFLTALSTWGIWNSVAYITGQFLEWEHGRFYSVEPDQRALPIQETTGMKIAMGAAMGASTALVGSVWCIVFGTLFIWLPGVRRAQRESGE